MPGMRERLRAVAQTIRRELAVYQMALGDRRTPFWAKALFWLALGYVFLPFDIIPDFIPVLGQLDDLVIVPGLILLAIKLTPPEVVRDCRARVAAASRERGAARESKESTSGAGQVEADATTRAEQEGER